MISLDSPAPICYHSKMKINKALEIATRAHEGQTRNLGVVVPYIVHPIAVFNKLLSVGVKDENTLCAALLHDSVEDSEDREKVRKEIAGFDLDILSIVEEVTLPENTHGDYSNPSAAEKRRKKYEHIGNTLKNGSNQAVLVKLCDRICNVNDFMISPDKDYAAIYCKMFLSVCPTNFTGLAERLQKELAWLSETL